MLKASACCQLRVLSLVKPVEMVVLTDGSPVPGPVTLVGQFGEYVMAGRLAKFCTTAALFISKVRWMGTRHGFGESTSASLGVTIRMVKPDPKPTPEMVYAPAEFVLAWSTAPAFRMLTFAPGIPLPLLVLLTVPWSVP